MTFSNDVAADFPERLRIERKRLGLSQEAFGALGNVSKSAQYQYEAARNWPTGEYLESLRKNNVDVAYIVSGARNSFDWDLIRNAFMFVQQSFVDRKDRQYTADELFEVFRAVIIKAGEVKKKTDVRTTDVSDEKRTV